MRVTNGKLAVSTDAALGDVLIQGQYVEDETVVIPLEDALWLLACGLPAAIAELRARERENANV
jgi:hypothetical protein